jgi:hypothetical protein
VTAVKPYAARTTGWLTGGASLPAGAVASEGEGTGRLTSGDGVSVVRGRERGVGRRWAEGEGVASARGGSSRGRGLETAQLGGRVFLFLFIFQILFIFLHPFFE